ncbi:MAG: hypothetical protein RR618_03675 [Cellulosilyticaceae bacterium]
MKKLGIILLTLVVGSSGLLTACSRTARDDANVAEMENGQVVEMEGPQDQYGWFPHIRLTFDGDVLTQVYFDYIDDEAAKKSQDEEYNSTMQEKTGMSAKEAMEKLRADLLETQDPAQVDIVAGASQTSAEFIELAKQGFEKYFAGKTSANNYGEPAKESKSQESKDTTGNTGQEAQAGATGDTGSTTGEGGTSKSDPISPYTTGGDGNPNSQSGGNSSQSSSSGGGQGGGGNTN